MTQQEIDDFRTWHDNRLQECGYPIKIVLRLINDREAWLPKAK